MGQPKKQRRKYERPKRPYDRERIERERKLLQEYGLRRKKEIWAAESILRDFRRRARELQARENEKNKKELLEKMNKIGIKCSTLDEVLGIALKDILDRRLQTIIQKKNYASSMKHARQLITHGRVSVDDRKIRWPSYIVPIELEDKIRTKMEAGTKSE